LANLIAFFAISCPTQIEFCLHCSWSPTVLRTDARCGKIGAACAVSGGKNRAALCLPKPELVASTACLAGPRGKGRRPRYR
jgi:hypothetical protein